jgi:hypothetical protein
MVHLTATVAVAETVEDEETMVDVAVVAREVNVADVIEE